MKDRIYNKALKREVLKGIHPITKDCVELPHDSPIFNKLPAGKTVSEDAKGIPVLVDKVITPLTLAQRAKALKKEALAFQDEFMSTNERGIINGYDEEVILTKKPKALKNRQWADKIFWIYENRLKDVNDDTPFSNAGIKPHSYKELKEEKRSVDVNVV